jgi:hypothetical protein
MNETLEQVPQAEPSAEVIPTAPEQVETREFDEAGLEQFAETMGREVEAQEVVVLGRADKQIEGGAGSLGLDQGTARAIFESGGFSASVNGAKQKILALAQTAKNKIAALFSPKSASVPMEEIAGAEPLAETQPAEAAPQPQVETAVENLEQFLGTEVFSQLGIDSESEQGLLTEANEGRIELIKKSFENTRNSVRAFFEMYSEQGIIDQKQRKTDEERPGEASDSKDYRVKVPKEDLLKALAVEASKTKENHAVTLNMNWKGVMLMLRDSKLKTFEDLKPEQKLRLYRTYANYGERRQKTEQDLGFAEDASIAYGCYANTEGKEAKTGGAGTYGDFFIEIEPPENISYTEGDSFNGNDTLAGARKREDIKEEYTQVRGRQILEGQVHIAKAIYNLEKSYREQYDSGGTPTYIEAQIPNFKMDMIKRINVPDENARQNILINLDKVPNGEYWRDKIKIVG